MSSIGRYSTPGALCRSDGHNQKISCVDESHSSNEDRPIALNQQAAQGDLLGWVIRIISAPVVQACGCAKACTRFKSYGRALRGTAEGIAPKTQPYQVCYGSKDNGKQGNEQEWSSYR